MNLCVLRALLLALPKIQIELSSRYRLHLVIGIVDCYGGCCGENNLRSSGNMSPWGWWHAEASIASLKERRKGGGDVYITWVMEKLSLIAGKNMWTFQKKKKRENKICTTVIQLLYAVDMTAAVEATTVLHRLQVKTGTVIHYKCQTVPMNSVIQCLTALASFHSIIKCR